MRMSARITGALLALSFFFPATTDVAGAQIFEAKISGTEYCSDGRGRVNFPSLLEIISTEADLPVVAFTVAGGTFVGYAWFQSATKGNFSALAGGPAGFEFIGVEGTVSLDRKTGDVKKLSGKVIYAFLGCASSNVKFSTGRRVG